MKAISGLRQLLTAPCALAFGLILSGVLYAQTVVTLPDSGQTTTATANVSEQARVVVPAGVTFDVVDISQSTVANAATVTIDNIVLASASKQLKVSIQAAAAAFTPSVESAATWSASDITWNAASWTNANGSLGTLSDSTFNTVATCDADAAACSTSGLVFTLGSKQTVKRSGNHTLNLTWKFESVAGV